MIQLPFLLGAAVGAGAILLFNNNKKVKETATKGYEAAKEGVACGVNTIKATAECVKEKVEAKKEEEPQEEPKKEETLG